MRQSARHLHPGSEDGVVAADAHVQCWAAALGRLDRWLASRLEDVGRASDPTGLARVFRGLALTAQDVVRLLERSPAASLLGNGVALPLDALVGPLRDEPRVRWLCETFGLEDLDLAALLLALAPELDTRYERLYGFLQDDLTRTFATVDLCLYLFCPGGDARFAGRARLAGDGPLRRHRLVELLDPGSLSPSSLGAALRLAPQVAHFLLYEDVLDHRLQDVAAVSEAATVREDVPGSEATRRTVASLERGAAASNRPLHVYLRTGDERQASAIAALLAARQELRVLHCDAGTVLHSRRPPDALALLFREAWLRDLALHVRSLEALAPAEGVTLRRALFAELETAPGLVVLSGTVAWPAIEEGSGSVAAVDCRELDPEAREGRWRRALRAAPWTADAATLAALGERFRLTAVQIDRAAAAALRALDAPAEPRTVRRTLFVAAREQSGHRLSDLATRISPRHAWDDIVLPDEARGQLREICSRVSGRAQVLARWGFDRRLSHGKGTSVLFFGPSGTGKTMAAEVVAHELGLDLYKIDLAAVVSKYIGETEQNLERVFTAADDANAILLFDEADALFGKRSEVRDSHDRYANLEISYLLQRIERYDGVAILSTNLRQNLDDAFQRRFAFAVAFPFPDAAERRRIWTAIWPAQTPLAGDVDLDFLAARFKLSGGHIKNVALAGAFLAAEEGCPVSMRHLLHATRREYQKAGRALADGELQPAGVPEAAGLLQ